MAWLIYGGAANRPLRRSGLCSGSGENNTRPPIDAVRVMDFTCLPLSSAPFAGPSGGRPAVLLSYLLLGEEMRPAQITGGGPILVGILAADWRSLFSKRRTEGNPPEDGMMLWPKAIAFYLSERSPQ